MEPFGLFQFLQNLLNSDGNSPSISTPEPPEAIEPNPPPNEPKEMTPSQNAAAKFLEKHERRAGRKK